MQKYVRIGKLKFLYCLYPIFLFAFILFDLINVHCHFPAHTFLFAPHFLWRSSSSLALYLFVFDFRCVGVKWREGSSKGKYNYTECSCSGFPPPHPTHSLLANSREKQIKANT